MMDWFKGKYELSEEQQEGLQGLLSGSFADLPAESRSALEALIVVHRLEYAAAIASRIQADVLSGKFTKKEFGEVIGMHGNVVGKMINHPEYMSDRFIGLVSAVVEGYEDIYSEYRRRTDAIYTPPECSSDVVKIDTEVLSRLAGRATDDFVTALEAIKKDIERMNELRNAAVHGVIPDDTGDQDHV